MAIITGTDGNNTLRGTSADDTISGLAGNDSLTGSGGADALYGGTGNDTLNMDAADTAIDGGDGTDTVVVQGTAGVTLDLDVSSIERVTGGAGADTLNAATASAAVTVYGGAGGDTITGSAFNDALRGDDGDDTISGGAGNDSIVGGAGADRLSGGTGNDTLYIDADDTLVDGGDGIDTVVVQGASGVVLDLGAGRIEKVQGGAGGDRFDAASASWAVQVLAGVGDDTVLGGSANDDLRGDAGDDVIDGGAGNDTIQGGAGADRLFGGAGDDTLYIDAADTLIDGGAGTDTVRLSETFDLTLDLGASGIERVYAGAGADRLDASAVAAAVRLYGGAGADTLLGVAGNDDLRGDDGDDTVQGGAGNDTIQGGAGADRLSGGAGDDSLYVDADDALDLAASAIERAFGGAGADTLNGAASSARIVAYGGTGDDTITGSGFNDDLRGDTGNDVIQGGAGNDTILGGAGADSLSGGVGDDVLYVDAADTLVDGGAGTDTVYIQDTAGAALDLAASAVERVFGGTGADLLDGGASTAAVLIYGGAGNDAITGSAFNDDLRGDAGDDVIDGGAGNDTILGGTGADRLSGGAGDDKIYADAADTLIDGGAGFDTLTIQDTAGVTLDLAAVSIERAYGGAGADTLDGASLAAAVLIYGGAGNDTITGSAFNDDLRGDAGDDTIRGGAGNDVIYGGAGADALSGEAGNDTFYIDATDTVSGGDGTDSVYIQDAAGVTLDLGAASVERAFGGTGNDTLSGASSAVGVTLYGGAGNDTITGSGFNDDLRGDAGDDTIRGGAGNDVIYGGTGADTLYGLGGNDTFYIDAADTVSGGDGTDSVYIQDTAGIAFDLGAAAVERAFGGTGSDTLTGASAAVGVIIYGGAGNDLITGSGFNDDLRGDAGDDVLEGGAGRDLLYGGTGIDTAHYDHSSSAVTVSLLTGKGTGGQAEGDTFNSIENLVGSAFADRLEGDATANRLTGGGGADTLLGGAGDDVLEVADTRFTRIDGGAGDDTLRFGGQTLTLAEEAVTNLERIDLIPGVGQLVVLDRASVLAATDSRRLLRITGGSDGTVLFRESEWVLERTETVGGQDYRVYRNGDAAVAVQTAVRQSPNKLLIGTTLDDDFTFDPGDGHVVMFTHGGDDTLRLSDGLRTIDAHLERVGNDLIVWWDGAPDRLTVINHFAPDGGSGEGALSHLVFANGEGTWDVRAEQLILGGPSNDTLTLGTNQITATTIFGGGGLDEVVIGPGITIDRVQLIRVGNDLRVTIDNSTVMATIINHFGATGPGSGTGGVERLRFTDGGEVWTISGDHVILGTPADDAWTLGRGCGKVTVFREPTGSSDIRLGADITADQVSMVRIGLDLHLKIDNSTDEVVLVNHFAGNAEQGGVHTVTFDTGTQWNITGKLVMVGGPGDDHFQINRGVGSRTVYAGGGGDRIELGPQISVSDVKLIRVGNDLKISIDNSSDQITVINHFADTGGAGPATVRELSFADGTSWTIHGDTIWMGGEGNDIVTLQTGCGPHTVYFGGGWDHIAIGDTVRASDLRMVRLGDDLEISIDNSTDKLTVLNHFGAGYGSSPARTLTFTDGTVWNVKGENILIGGEGDDSFGVDESDRDVLIYRGGTGYDSLTVGPNIRHADVQLIRVGNDLEMWIDNSTRIATVVNQFAEGVTGTGSLTEITFLDDGTTWNVKGDKILIGGPGDDTFVVRKNVGHYTVYPGSGYNDIKIGDDIAEKDVRLVRVGDDLKLSIDNSDTEVTFLNHFADGAGSSALRNVTHNDGTVWNIEGENILIGGPGNDGFTVDKGTGSVTVYPGKGSDEIRFGASVTAAEVSLIRVGNDLRMDIANTADSVLLVNHFAGSAGGPGSVTKLTYHDGSSWNIEGANILVGGEGNDRFHVDKGMGQRVAYVGPGSNHIDIADQVSRSDVLVSRVGNDLVISLDNSSDELTVLNHFTSAPVRDLVFNDLTTWNVVGENILIGGPGDDSFVVNKGLDGVLNATVIFSGGGDHNRIKLGDTIDTSNVQMIRVGDDLRVRIDNSTDDLLVVNHFAASGGSAVEDIEFVGGTTWNIKGENILIGGVGDDAFQLDKGNGPQFFYASGGDNHVVIGAGISASSLRISRVGNDLKMTVDNSTDEMTVVNHFLFGGGIRDVTFNNGTVWNVWGENILIGGPGNDGFTVTKGSGPRTLFAGTTDGLGEIRVGEGISQSEIRVERVGDDMVVRIDNSDDQLTIINHFAGAPVRQLVFGDRQYLSLSGENLMIGGGGHDRFVVNPGTPEQKIYVSGGDSVEFGPDTIITDIRIVRVGDDIRIYTDNTQNFITIVNWQGGLEALNFPTGQRNLTMSGENLMIGGPGNNTFRVNRTGGGSGEAGSGEVIYIYAGGDDNTVELGDSITTSDVQLSRVGNDLEMTIDNSSKKVRIFNHFSPTPAGSAVGTAAQKIVFDNGTVWNVVGENILIGGPGNDNFTVNKGQGRLIVYPGGGGGTKRVVLGREIHVSDVRVERVGDDLRVYTADGTVDTVIVNHFGGGATGSACGCGGLDELTFDTGTTWTVTGENILIGGEGDDSFTVNETVPGSGPTYIHVGGGHHNVVRLGPTAVPANLRLFRVGNDLHVQSADGTTDAVVVNHFGGGIETVYFAGGVTWNVVGENILIGGEGDDTFTVNEASGDQIIYMSGGSDTVRLTGGTTRIENVIIDRVGDDLEIRFNNSTRKIKVVNNFAGCAGDGVAAIAFDDGSTLSLTGDRTLAGTAGNDVLTGGSGNDTVDTLAGNDILSGGKGTDTLKGGSGDDIYRFAAGDGKDTIVESAGTDEIQFGAGLAASSLVMRISGDDLVLSFTGTADEVRISHHFGASGYKVERARFSDGTIVPLALDADLVLTYTGTDAAETITGRAGRDLITGGKGNDSLNGGAGDDTYYINAGDGQDTITETGGSDTIRLGAGFDPAKLYFSRFGNDLYVRFRELGDQIIVAGRFNGADDGANYVETLQFQNGTTVDLTSKTLVIETQGGVGGETLQGYKVDDVIWGNGGNDALYGYGGDDQLYGDIGADSLSGGAGSDLLDGGEGSDTLYGEDGEDKLIGGSGNDTLNGGTGNDLYLVNLGDGQDYITDSGGADIIQFGLGLDAGKLYYGRSGNDLYVRFRDLTDQVGISSRFGGANFAETLKFADGTVVDLTSTSIGLEIQGGWGTQWWNRFYGASDETLEGYSGDDAIWGNNGADNIYGYGGNDRLYGGAHLDYLYGGDGDDTIDGGDHADVLYGQAGNDTLLGGGDNDSLDGGAGDDRLSGEAGDDSLAAGDGTNVLDGGAGNDSLSAGAGDDDLTGGAGNDSLSGGGGNDRYRFGRGDGVDTIVNSDAVSPDDRVILGEGISASQLWFERISNDLRVSIIGTSDQITVKSWYLGGGNPVDAFQTADGKVLLTNQVEQLRSAMAAFSAPPQGQLELSPEQHTSLDGILATAWH